MVIEDLLFEKYDKVNAIIKYYPIQWIDDIQQWIDYNIYGKFNIKLETSINVRDDNLILYFLLEYDDDRDFILFKLFWL